MVGERTGRQMRRRLDNKPEYTPRQGQFLAFIHYYSKLNGCPPAENDMVRYFRITPPSAHQMVVTLEQRGLIERVPGRARSIRLLLDREDLPDLE
ncbi:MAG: MarR family transcriptional regulator [Phycisphaerae bacterium]